VGTLKRFKLRHHAKISWRSVKLSRRYADFSIFFQFGGFLPSWICDARDWTTHEGHLVIFITVQNLVGIDAVVSITCIFLFREFGLKMPIHAPKIGIFGDSNETRAVIANPPNSAPLGGAVSTTTSSYIRVRAVVWACSRGQTHRQTHRRGWPQYISRRLRLMRNVDGLSQGAHKVNTRTQKHACCIFTSAKCTLITNRTEKHSKLHSKQQKSVTRFYTKTTQKVDSE